MMNIILNPSCYKYEHSIVTKARPCKDPYFWNTTTVHGPLYLVNFDKRESVEQGRFLAWGYLVYDAPLTEKQMADYKLQAALGNPDRKAPMREPGESKSIAAQLAEGAKQAARDNAALQKDYTELWGRASEVLKQLTAIVEL